MFSSDTVPQTNEGGVGIALGCHQIKVELILLIDEVFSMINSREM